MNFKIYIFGTPYEFDLYPYEKRIKIQFQMYEYNDSENIRFAIERTEKNITYSYLRYNLISEKNIPGAFFGMAVEFENEYCSDIKSLYSLFDSVYTKVILKDGILLNLINKQIKYNVFSFKNKNVEIEIKNIENIIRKNIEKLFIDDIKSLTTQTFKYGINENLWARMSIDEENVSILNAMKEYPKFSLSPEYPKSSEIQKNTQQNLTVLDNKVQVLHEKITLLENKIINPENVKIESKENKSENDKEIQENEILPANKKHVEVEQNKLFKDGWIVFLFFIAIITTIWFFISIYNIVKTWFI